MTWTSDLCGCGHTWPCSAGSHNTAEGCNRPRIRTQGTADMDRPIVIRAKGKMPQGVERRDSRAPTEQNAPLEQGLAALVLLFDLQQTSVGDSWTGYASLTPKSLAVGHAHFDFGCAYCSLYLETDPNCETDRRDAASQKEECFGGEEQPLASGKEEGLVTCMGCDGGVACQRPD